MLTICGMGLPGGIQRIFGWLCMVLQDEKGQGLVEYGLIISFVVLVSVAGVSAFGTGVDTLVQDIVDKIPAAH